MAEPTEPLILDIDLYLAELWVDVHGLDCWDEEIAGNFLRAAFGIGYMEALREVARGEGGKLCSDHGYAIP